MSFGNDIARLFFHVLVPAKTSPSKAAITYAESRKVQFDSFESGFQYKPKRDVGKLTMKNIIPFVFALD